MHHSPWFVRNVAWPARVAVAHRSVASLRLLRGRDARIGYLGWVGFSNMGDEVMLDACRRAFHPEELTPFPDARTLGVLTALSRRPLARAAILGGGTLIGRASYRASLERLAAAYPELPLLTLGTGVAHPAFSEGGAKDRVVLEELPRWAALLHGFARVTVRGPISRSILESVGVSAEVVGDPGLLIDRSRPPSFRERLIGVNLGITTGLYGNDPEKLLDDVAAACRRLLGAGHDIRLIPLWPRDVAYITECARRIGRARVDVVTDFSDAEALLTAIGECHVVIGQKLHSVVFASALSVPSIMLEYNPKGSDFLQSIGRETFGLRTDRITGDDLLQMVEELVAERDRHASMIGDAVSLLRSRLQAEVEDIRLGLSRGRR